MFTYNIDERSETDKLIILALNGILDSKNALDFYEFVITLEPQFSRYIFNCDHLTAVSSSGISILLRIRKKFIQKNYIPIFSGFNQELQDLFQFFGFNKLFYVTRNVGAAKNILRTMHPIKEDVAPQDSHSIPYSLTKKNEIGIMEEIETSPEPILTENRLETKTYTPMFLSGTNISGIDKEENITEDINTNATQTIEPKKDFEFTIPFITKSNELKEEDIKDSIIIEEEIRGYQEKFTELLINCGNCSTKIKIKKQGRQKCPTCGAKFLLRQSGSISTIEKI
jgi:anti-anti-sigma regulatory factor